jgi:hypothetical protein
MQDTGDATAALGLRRFLVKTGKYRPGDENDGRLSSRPDWVGENFAAAVEAILSES